MGKCARLVFTAVLLVGLAGCGLFKPDYAKPAPKALRTYKPKPEPAYEKPHDPWGAEYAAQPIPHGKDALTGRDYERLERRVVHRLYTGSYEKLSTKRQPWDAPARRLLLSFEQFLTKQPAPLDAKLALPTIAALEKADCSDALVRCAMGVLAQEAGKSKQALANLDRSEALQAKHPYPPACLWVSGSARFSATVDVKGVAAANAAYEFIAKGWNDFADALDEPRSEPGEERVLISLAQRPLRTFGGAQRLVDALAKHPKADAYVAGVLQGQYYWSKVVGNVGMSERRAAEKKAEFAGYLAKARDGLTAAWKLHPSDPEAAGVMVSITALGYGGPGETPRTWFDRAVAAQLDYPPAYDSLIEALQLAGGAQLRSFAEECLSTGRFDTGVPWRYYETLDAAGGFRDDKAYAGLKSVVDGYRAAAPDQDRTRRSTLLAVACGTARWDEAAALSTELGDKLDLAVLKEALRADPEGALAQADAHAAGVGANYDAAMAAAQGSDKHQAVKLLKALEAGPGSDRMHRHVHGVLQGVQIQEALH